LIELFKQKTSKGDTIDTDRTKYVTVALEVELEHLCSINLLASFQKLDTIRTKKLWTPVKRYRGYH